MKTILVPTDFSKPAINAMKFAIRLGGSIDARLTFFHAASNDQVRHILSSSERRRRERALVHEKTMLLEKTLKDIYIALNLNPDFHQDKIIVKTGRLVVEDVMEAARKIKADLIVMGTHGVTGTAKLFGSNTSNLIAKSPYPVLAVPMKYRYKSIRNILYASDLKDAIAQIKVFLPLAKALDARIDIFNISEIKANDDERIYAAIQKKTGYRQMRFLRMERHIDQTFLQQLQEFIRYRAPGMLIMFPHERNLFRKLFSGSKTEKLSYHLQIPLLSIRQVKEQSD